MTRNIRNVLLGLILLGHCSCIPTLTAISHNQDMAAIKAILFAKEAFIDLNQPGAYDLLSEEMRRDVSLDKFINVIARMHPVAFPRVVVATDYEPMPGQKSMFIWLYGEYGEEKFYYRLTMLGTTETDYRVAGMFRVPELPPSQMRKPLPVKRSTAGLR